MSSALINLLLALIDHLNTMHIVRMQILSADESGIGLIYDGWRWTEPWTNVEQILLARIDWGEDESVLAAAIALEGRNRALVIYEIQAEWNYILAAAQQALPGFLPQEFWEPDAMLPDEGLLIYERNPKLRKMH